MQRDVTKGSGHEHRKTQTDQQYTKYHMVAVVTEHFGVHKQSKGVQQGCDDTGDNAAEQIPDGPGIPRWL